MKLAHAQKYGHVTLSVRSFRFQEETGRNFSTVCRELTDSSINCRIFAQICISSVQVKLLKRDLECRQPTSKIFALDIFGMKPKSLNTVIFYDDGYSQNTTLFLWIKIYGLVTLGIDKSNQREELIPVALYSTALSRHVIKPHEGLTGVGPLDNIFDGSQIFRDMDSTFESGWYFAREKPILRNLKFATLSLKVILVCQSHYYGCLCTKFCLADFRYSCDDETGEKICIKSYYPRNHCDIRCVESDSNFCTDQGQIVCKPGIGLLIL
uniref:DSL domain-containing protein n=1 Tax=Romanomermis culicivorax TaxID=13658 RepID=A0A915KPI8_ROMCU